MNEREKHRVENEKACNGRDDCGHRKRGKTTGRTVELFGHIRSHPRPLPAHFRFRANENTREILRLKRLSRILQTTFTSFWKKRQQIKCFLAVQADKLKHVAIIT